MPSLTYYESKFLKLNNHLNDVVLEGMNSSTFTKTFTMITVIIVSFTSLSQGQDKQLNVGLLIAATGKYLSLTKPLIESGRKYFLTNHNVTYFVFTDSSEEFLQADDIVVIYQKHLGWPFATLMRFE